MSKSENNMNFSGAQIGTVIQGDNATATAHINGAPPGNRPNPAQPSIRAEPPFGPPPFVPFDAAPSRAAKPAHVDYAVQSPTEPVASKLAVIIAGFLSLLCVSSGVVALWQNSASPTELSFGSLHLTTGSVGIVLCALGIAGFGASIVGFQSRARSRSRRHDH